MLLDSNIIIYAAQPENIFLRSFIASHTIQVSIISYIEVLGYHKINATQEYYFKEFFLLASTIQLSWEIAEQAMLFRRDRKITLGDSIIAASAFVHKLELVTRNIDDFKWIDGLSLINPFSLRYEGPPS
jgi:hypothetical protein